MPRTIPISLQNALATGATTMCLILRIDPKTQGYDSFGAVLLDRSIVYDDLISEITYSAIVGMQSSTLAMASDLSVDNADVQGLMPEFEFPISEADIVAGVYDFAEFTAYMVDYENLTAGNHLVVAHGTLGQFRVINEGLSFVEELRGLSDQLKQSLCQKDSLTCRAVFGSGPIGSGADVEELFPCNFDVSSLLVSGQVDSVGLENTITFGDASLAFEEDELALGMVKWTTGANAGRSIEIESNTDDGTVTLGHPVPFPIQIGDEFVIRPGCNKHPRDAEKGCKRWWAADWVRRFRGEADIPIGDAGALETPGASSSPGQGGAEYEPLPEAE